MRKRCQLLVAGAAFCAVSGLAAPRVATAGPLLDQGALFTFTGSGASAGASGSIFDGDIHSGVFRSADGTLSDSYVLQGGDPFGGDTGDAFEESQAAGSTDLLGGLFTVSTHYAAGQPASQVGTFITGSPDTGFLTFTNHSGATWTGTIDLSGTTPSSVTFDNSATIVLTSGASVNILLNNESSNQGGYNPISPVPEPASLMLLGTGLLGTVRRLRQRK